MSQAAVVWYNLLERTSFLLARSSHFCYEADAAMSLPNIQPAGNMIWIYQEMLKDNICKSREGACKDRLK